jgi:hypothetical protein
MAATGARRHRQGAPGTTRSRRDPGATRDRRRQLAENHRSRSWGGRRMAPMLERPLRQLPEGGAAAVDEPRAVHAPPALPPPGCAMAAHTELM